MAGGKGTRFGGSTPKQFMELNGKPVVVHTLEAFFRYSRELSVVLVLPEEDFAKWDKISKKYAFNTPIAIVPGGPTRYHSVKAGLQQIGEEGLVAIHDGVRPLVTEDIIAASFKTAAVKGSAVAAVRLNDSIRRLFPAPAFDHSESVDRSAYRLVQTPQTFQTRLIKKAYAAEADSSLTDDAAVAERAGHSITLIEGSYDNLKITTVRDLQVAESLMNDRGRRRLAD